MYSEKLTEENTHFEANYTLANGNIVEVTPEGVTVWTANYDELLADHSEIGKPAKK